LTSHSFLYYSWSIFSTRKFSILSKNWSQYLCFLLMTNKYFIFYGCDSFLFGQFFMDFDLNLFKIHYRYAHECHVCTYLFWIFKYDYLIIVMTNTNMLLANKYLNWIWFRWIDLLRKYIFIWKMFYILLFNFYLEIKIDSHEFCV